MDIAALSVLKSQASMGQAVGLAIAKLSMNTADQASEAMRKMLELSVNSNLGGNFDQSV